MSGFGLLELADCGFIYFKCLIASCLLFECFYIITIDNNSIRQGGLGDYGDSQHLVLYKIV